MSCGIDGRRGSDPALLWLWCRPVASAPIQPLAWEPSHAVAAAQEIAKKTKKKEKATIFIIVFYLWPLFFVPIFAFSRAATVAYGDSQARGLIRAVATGLHQSHSNAGSEPHLRPTPQLTATLDR